jgi:hypothetical protein
LVESVAEVITAVGEGGSPFLKPYFRQLDIPKRLVGRLPRNNLSQIAWGSQSIDIEYVCYLEQVKLGQFL